MPDIDRGAPISPRRGRRIGLSAVLALILLLAGCGGGGEGEDAAVRRAEANVTAKENALSDAQSEFSAATTEFCDASADYIVALDRYGDVLTTTVPTVGDVTDAGSDLAAPQEDVMQAAEDAVTARDAVTAAETELAEAKSALKAAKKGTEPSPVPSPTASPTPLAPPATVNRVKQAETEFEQARSGIDDRTPLVEASQAFNAAAVALEMSWLHLFADAGCLGDEQQKQAAEAVRTYTLALQQSLQQAGYYDAEVDGIYGPATVAAVESLQEAHGLPVTGTVDKATAEALQADVLAAGGQAAQAELAATAALQQTLKIAGFWDGPVDGIWTPALTQAVKDLQTELDVKPTGVVDAATVAAFQEALAEAREPTVPEETPSETPTTEAPEAPTTETPEATPTES